MENIDKAFIPFDWNAVEDRSTWLDPCEESYYYAAKWQREGRRTLLDLGCGLGRHSVFFAKQGFEVTGMDISDDALAYLKDYAQREKADVRMVRADMLSLPFEDSSFDCIFAMHSAGHADTPGMKRIMGEMRRVLKPGGAVFMTLCSKDTWSFKNAGYPSIDENTLVKTEGAEKGVPHFYIDKKGIPTLFEGFDLIRVRHIDDCYNKSDSFSGGRWIDMKHFFIEAAKA